MDSGEPDIEQLFAPIAPTAAYGVILREAHDVLAHVHAPVDAELWGSDIIGALARTTGGQPEAMSALAASLVPAAEEAATPEGLALLRIFAVLGTPELRQKATHAAERTVATGIPDPTWARDLGTPAVGDCWHYSDISGQQESLTATFDYGARSHALSVLIDHNKGGGIRDVWVDDAEGLLDKTWMAAESDPLVVFEKMEARALGTRLQQAIAAGECPAKPDEADDVTAHRALLHARANLLAGI
ncbi:MAG TPA: hypothetical protein VG142_10430 [Trebonia sp.]|jgi:hypothetical protein|nr:hypothetical protein [Trebonia sp.]